MYAISPRQVLQNIADNIRVFVGASISFSTTGGRLFSGNLISVCRDKDGLSAIVKDVSGENYQWILANGIDSITVHHATEQQLAVMGGATYDPLAKEREPGKLELARILKTKEARLEKALGKPIKVIIAESSLVADDADRAMQIAVIQSTLDILISTFETNFQSEFERQEIRKAFDVIEFQANETSAVDLKDLSLRIKCAWQTIDSRWNDLSLAKALNECF